MAENEKTEQIRRLINNIHLAGRLGELEIKTGKTKKDIDYISLRGVIICGEEPVYSMRFRSFAQAKKSDGTDSKAYVNLCNWAKKAVPMTKNPEEFTWVDAKGSIRANDYVNQQGKLVEGYEINLNSFNDFTEYACELDFEGYIAGIKDETKGEENDPTGRKILYLIGKNTIGNDIIELKNIIVPDEYAEALEENEYETGRTAIFFMTYIPNHKEEIKSGGIGKQRVTSGTNYLEMVMTGADPVYSEDSDKSLSTALIKNARQERKTHLKEIEEKGYLGGADGDSDSDSSGGTSKSSGVGQTRGKLETVDDDEIPF